MRCAVKQGEIQVLERNRERTRDALIRRGLVKLSKKPGFIEPTQKAVNILQEEARLQGWANVIVPAIAQEAGEL